MNAPFIWVILPGIIAVGLYFIRRWRLAVHTAGLLTALVLAWLAWQIPLGEPLPLRLWAGFPSWEVIETLTIFGRRLVLENSSRPALIVTYLGIGFWFGGAYLARTDRLFIPFGLGIAALLTASLAIEPGYFSLLFLESVVLASVPILSPPGRPLKRGVLRFLIFQTIGVCFILLADWSIPYLGLESSTPGSTPPAILLLGLGLFLIIAAFPFHTWIPMLAEDTHPYAAAFIFYSLPTAILFLILEYFHRYSSSGFAASMYSAILAIGSLMILTAGVWAAFERHLGRILGFAAIQQIGFALLALSLTSEAQTGSLFAGLFFAHLAPQAISLAVWSLALCAIRARTDNLGFGAVSGLARHTPVTAASLLLANFSVAGVPLLAGFPVYLALWSSLTHSALGIALVSLVGNACLFVAGVRTMAILVAESLPEEQQPAERGLLVFFLLLGSAMLFVIGSMPNWFFPTLTNLGLIFVKSGY